MSKKVIHTPQPAGGGGRYLAYKKHEKIGELKHIFTVNNWCNLYKYLYKNSLFLIHNKQ